MHQLLFRLRIFFCFFSGEDGYIIELCKESRIRNNFALIGFFVMLVFIGCWTSASLFMSHLFEGSIILSLFVGIIWAMLVTNLYLLLLYTISPALLPISREKKGKKGIQENTAVEKMEKPESAFTSSFIFRLSLIILLAIIITQPFNVLIFSPSFEASNLYAQEIRGILAKHPLSWLITVLGCTVFILPIYWKYKIRNRGGFYEKKRHIENKFVHDNYSEFKEIYTTIFKRKNAEYNQLTWKNMMPYLNQLEKVNPDIYNLYFENLKFEIVNEEVIKYEYWADHPFRTIQKHSVRNLSTEEDFLKEIYK